MHQICNSQSHQQKNIGNSLINRRSCTKYHNSISKSFAINWKKKIIKKNKNHSEIEEEEDENRVEFLTVVRRTSRRRRGSHALSVAELSKCQNDDTQNRKTEKSNRIHLSDRTENYFPEREKIRKFCDRKQQKISLVDLRRAKNPSGGGDIYSQFLLEKLR